MSSTSRIVVLLGALALGACAVGPPPGPSVAALPGKDKSLEAFQQDDASCRQYAAQTLGNVSPADAANQTTANSAVAGTLLGAAAGAAIGAAVGNPAAGAAIGAGSGLLLGTASGAEAGNYSAASVQRGYDISYAQCMTSRGDQVASNPAPRPGPLCRWTLPLSATGLRLCALSCLLSLSLSLLLSGALRRRRFRLPPVLAPLVLSLA